MSPSKDLTVYFFANGKAAVFDSDGQQPCLQESWLLLFVRRLEQGGLDPLTCAFIMPDGKRAWLTRTEHGYTWTTGPDLEPG